MMEIDKGGLGRCGLSLEVETSTHHACVPCLLVRQRAHRDGSGGYGLGQARDEDIRRRPLHRHATRAYHQSKGD